MQRAPLHSGTGYIRGASNCDNSGYRKENKRLVTFNLYMKMEDSLGQVHYELYQRVGRYNHSVSKI